MKLFNRLSMLLVFSILTMAQWCPDEKAPQERAGAQPGPGSGPQQTPPPADPSAPDWITQRLTGFAHLQLDDKPEVLSHDHSSYITPPPFTFDLGQLEAFLSKHGDQVKYLHLSDRKIGDAGVAQLAQHFPQGLTGLDLGGCDITDAGIQALAEKLPSGLTTLKLDHNKFGAKGAEVLSQYLPKGLTLMDLSYNEIGDQGIEALAKKMPKTLEALYIGESKISSVGLISLLRELPAPEALTTLWLAGNEIGKAGAKVLIAERAKFTNLKALELGGNRINDDKLTALELAYGPVAQFIVPQRTKKQASPSPSADPAPASPSSEAANGAAVDIPKWIQDDLRPIQGSDAR